MRFHYIWAAKTRHKKWYHHTTPLQRCTIVPVKMWAKIICCLNINLRSGHHCQHLSTVWPHITPLHWTRITTLPLACRLYPRTTEARVLTRKIGPTLRLKWGSYGHVPCRRPCLQLCYLATGPSAWSSDTFLWHIRKQVKKFSSGISNLMIRHENFFTISNTTTTTDKPEAFCKPSNTATRSHLGLDFKGTNKPLASVFRWHRSVSQSAKNINTAKILAFVLFSLSWLSHLYFWLPSK